NGEPRYPQTIPYEMHQVLLDLLNFSAVYLIPGGRLVYWLPTVTDEYTPDDVPIHPHLKLIANSNQCFGRWSRRLITMQKLNPGEKNLDFIFPVDSTNASSITPVPAHARFRDVYFTPKYPVFAEETKSEEKSVGKSKLGWKEKKKLEKNSSKKIE
ncbi:hypothetical protein HK096_007529, partial [Nowakowskiella sp. JEL0078]